MTALRSREVKALCQALEILHQEVDLDALPQRVFEVLEGLLPGCYITAQEFDIHTKAERHSANRPSPPGLMERNAELVPLEHPIFPVVMGGSFNVMRLSDFRTQRQLKRTAIFCETFKPLGVRHQIILPLRLPGHVAGISINRDRDFSDEEICLAQLLAPHFVLTHVHAQHLTELRRLQRSPIPTPEALTALGLTQREAETLHWVVLGKRDGEMAEIMGISVRTVEKHVQSILRKLAVETRTAAALRAVEAAVKT